MKLFTFLIILFIGINTSFAQNTFQKTYGGGSEQRCAVAQTLDGGYVIGGTTGSFVGQGGCYLVRTDAIGHQLWTKTYGGNRGDQIYDIQATTDGGFILAGTTASFGDRNGDLYLIRTDANGDTLWTRTYGSTLGEYARAVRQTSDGGFIAVGVFNTSSNNYMIRTKPNGDTLWTRAFQEGDNYGVIETENKGFVVTGTVNTGNDVDLFLYKTDSMGKVKWFRSYGGDNTEYGSRVIKANDGGYIAIGNSGSFNNGNGNGDLYLVKTDTGGNLLWSKAYSSAISCDGADLVSTGNGYTLLCRTTVNSGSFNSMLINIDNNGNLNWAKNYGGNYACNIIRANDGGYAFAGFNFANPSPFYLTKTDSLGNVGCNESVDNTVVVTTVTSHTDTLNPASVFGTVVGKPNAPIGDGGGTETTLCFSSAVQTVIPAANTLLVYPNPCTTCEIKGTTNANNLVVTDVLGRNAPVTLTPSSGGFTMQIQGNGIYFVRDVKTGKVVKVVKE